MPGGERALLLRTLPDSERIPAAVTDGARVVVIGAGWIGLKVPAAARSRGATVTVVETAALPLQNVLGDDIAHVFADLHREHGVTFHLGAQVAAVDDAGVRLADGTVLPADVVIAGIGVRPNVDHADEAGLAVDGRVAAGMNVNVWDVSNQIDALIRCGAAVDPARLAGPGVALTDLRP